MPPPPTTTLFPYTTLFRSHIEGAAHGQALRRGGDRAHYRRAGHGAHRGAETDRKSTRLNSSHVSISYAVFCLKKKTLASVRGPRRTPLPAPPSNNVALLRH